MVDITDKLLASLKGIDGAITKLDTSVDNLTRSLQATVKESSKSVDAMTEHRETMMDLEAESLDEIMMRKKSNKSTEDDIKLSKQLAELKRKELDLEKRLMFYKRNLMDAQGKNQEELQKRINGAEAKLAHNRKLQTSTTLLALGKFGKMLQWIVKFGLIAFQFIFGAVIGEYLRFKEAISVTSGVLEKSLGPTFADAQIAMERLTWATGLAYEELLKSVKANRQAVNAMGGTLAATKAWTGDIKRTFVGMTGDIDEGFRLMLESQNALRLHGFVPSNQAIIRYTLDIQKLGGMTNLATAEIASLYAEVASDTDSLVMLKAVREGEREAILATQRAMINLNVAAGMTADQAKAAAKMLNKMVAAKPLERIKEAARMRALGGAMGISGADAAAQAVMAGPGKQTAQMRKDIEDFSKNATTMMDQARGQGLGSEITAVQLLDKLNLDQYYGSDSPFSTTLISALKNQAGPMVNAINDSHLGKMMTVQETYNKTMSALAGEGVGLLRETSTLLSKLVEYAENPLKIFGLGGKKDKNPLENPIDKLAGSILPGYMAIARIKDAISAYRGINVEKLVEKQDIQSTKTETQNKIAADLLASQKRNTEIAEEQLAIERNNSDLLKNIDASGKTGNKMTEEGLRKQAADTNGRPNSMMPQSYLNYSYGR